MFKRLVIVDSLTKDRLGHFLVYTEQLRRVAKLSGLDVRCYINDRADPSIVAELNASPVLQLPVWDIMKYPHLDTLRVGRSRTSLPSNP